MTWRQTRISTHQTAPLRAVQPDGSKCPLNQFILTKIPANRWGEASDLGGSAVFLASAISDFVNDYILYVDGGILAYIGRQPAGGARREPPVKIALINENSQTAKNGIILAVLRKVVEPMATPWTITGCMSPVTKHNSPMSGTAS